MFDRQKANKPNNEREYMKKHVGLQDDIKVKPHRHHMSMK